MRRDIDEALRGWAYEPGSGETQAREIRTRDGRLVLQVRIELGLLQMEVDRRPDGTRPHGFDTYLEYLLHRARRSPSGSESRSSAWMMQAEHRVGIDSELEQFYRRRMAWLALQRYDRAIRDADHTLALMDFIARHGHDEQYVLNHERLRGVVLFHRAQAAAALALERRRPDEAIEAIQEGITVLQNHIRHWQQERDEDEIPDPTLIEQLRQTEEEIRKHFAVGKTLREQLDEAVAVEDYEKAARLRDQIRLREQG